ncbi:PKD domain-containing protein [Ilyomonas limi]|uniref:PKD domain-containing protein n=1 Tax=Ilyomonas limi TaxID=2575867 RepID=A0A4U3KYM2_9BACT|nr:PKD domain-containing protein [Ilyomonas limi]TKK67482.1 PKD domain-containing protein [Ilyomonas limi]
MVRAEEWLKHFVCLIACVIISFMAAAQTADFTATPTSGCSPLSVIFTNTSTGFSANATYNWDFGNGNSSALKDSVGAQYKDEHDYTVTLTVTDNNQTYTKSTTITVYKKPLVDFSANTLNGCAPLPVTFTSNSTPGDGTIASYFWDFGDGATASGTQETVHTYQSAATISPSLTVTNSFGCYSTAKKTDLIQVLPSVNPAFTASQTVLCTVNDAVTFINNSTGEGTLSYHWDFGDGQTSIDKVPEHLYSSKGTYNVKLEVTNSDGCTADTAMPAYINVANYNADFEVPALACEHTNITFTDISNPQPTSYTQQLWIVDGQQFSIDSSQFSYSFTAGQHTVQLIDVFGTCKDTAIKNITVLEKPAITGFVVNIQNTCGAPTTVQFKDTTANITKWEWDVDNTTNSNFEPTNFTSATSYTYTADGTYYAWLRTTNAAGCTAEIVQPITIKKVSADIHSSAGQYGCDSLTTTFSALSSQVIKETVWNFGDNTPTTTDKTPEHVFKQPGDYQVILNYKTADGCSGVATYTVHVTPRPKFDFTAVPGTTVCGSTPVSFNVTGSNLDGNYFWNFGDQPGYRPGTIDQSHQYRYDSTFTVSLVITKEGCSDTVTKKDYITVLPPFPNIHNQAHTCEGTRGLVTYEDTTKATNWSWDFGDGTPAYTYNSPQQIIQHTYSKSGTYIVKLTAKSGNCTVTDSVNTFVLLRQSPVLTSTLTELCGSDNLPLVVSDVETNPAAVFFGFNHDYNMLYAQYRDSSLFAGTYTSPDDVWRNTFHLDLTDLDNTKKDLRIITTSYYFNCLDTTNYIPIKIKGPKAGFEIQNNDNCFKDPLTFTDTSKSSNGAAIVKWEWNFGDGNTTAKINSNPFDYQYQTPGTYNILLRVTDKTGCTDTAQHTIRTNFPLAAFEMSENPVLPDSNVYFYNRSVISDTNNYNNSAFTWMFGDGTIIKNVYRDSIPVHHYATTGVDTVMLIARDNLTTCSDTAVQLLYVKNLNLNFTYTTEFVNPGSGCPPIVATFTSTTVNTSSISWDFGDGTTIGNNGVPQHTYNKPGKYKVTLYGYFRDGTVDSVFQYITIQGPYATLRADKQFVCGAQPIMLTAQASNATSYTWDFGDGTLTGAADTFAVHNYLTPGMYTPSLIVKDSNNCSFPFFLEKPIIIDTLHLAIQTRPEVVCDSSIVLFTPDIISVAKDVAKVPLQYHWSFGTGKVKDTANTESPAFLYSKTGTYPVTLSAASPYGCAAETSVDIVVNPTPKAGIKGPASLCQDDWGNFIGSADISNNSLTWEWHFPNGSTSAEQKPAQQQFIHSGTDPVMLVVNENGCYDTAYSPLTVYAKPLVNLQPVRPQICAGQSVQLTAHDGISYKWTPNKSINDNTIANPFVAPDSTTLYKVAVTNSNGCVNTDSVMVRVVQRFAITAMPLLYVCRGSSAQLNVSGADIYQWIEGSGLSNTNTSNPAINTTTAQTYKVVGYDSSHCFTDTAITEVRIVELPTVNAGNNISTFAGSPVTLAPTTSPDVTGWNWQPEMYLSCSNCPSPVSIPQANITYVVQVNNEYGCVAKDSVQINVLCKQSLIQIPSAFTPNGDGINERFNVRGSGIKQINRFAIFNRDGQMLFERTNMSAYDENAGWDGTFKGKAVAPGTYVYIASIVCATGEVYHYKGTVVLIR